MNEVPEADLRSLVATAEITDLAVAYCWAIDGHDWSRLEEIFLPDASADLATAGVHEGRAAIVERIRAALGPLDVSQHLVSNHEVWIDGDTATHRCQMQAQHVREAAVGGPHYLVAGRYEDRLVRTPEGWRIAHRDLIISWTDGNRRVVRP